MEYQTVKVKDKSGKEHKWIIEEELDKAYKIFSNGIITYIYKAGCYSIENQLYSIETRNNKYINIPDCSKCSECLKCFGEQDENIYDKIQLLEDRSIDLGYLEDGTYGLDIIYDKEGNAYGV